MNFDEIASIMERMEPHHQKTSLAVFYAILSALEFSLMSVFVRMASGHANASVIIFIRFFISFLILLPILIVRSRRGTFAFKGSRWSLHLLRGISGLLSITLYIIAIHYIPLVDALLLESTYPLFMPLVVWIGLGIRSSLPLMLAVVAGFIGVIFVLRPGHISFHWADLLALASGLFAAIALLTIRQLNKTDRRINIMVNFFILSLFISGIFVVFQWRPIDAMTWFFLVLVGVSATLYQYTMTAALSHAPARIVSPLLYSALIFTGLIEWYFWDYIPSVYTVIGMVIIVVSGTAVVLLRDR